MRNLSAAMAALLYIASPAVAAEDFCSAYVGLTTSPISFESAAEPFRKIAPKDEFETTLQYEARVAAATFGSAATLVIERQSVGVKPTYDADASEFLFDGLVLGGYQMRYNVAFIYAGVQDQVDVGIWSNVASVTSLREVSRRTRLATNAFGATTEVTVRNRQVKAVFDHGMDDTASMFRGVAERYDISGRISLAPADAKRLKSELRYAVVASPKPPFLVSGKYRSSVATMDDPREVNDTFEVLIADIRCMLVLDRSGKVFGSFATH